MIRHTGLAAHGADLKVTHGYRADIDGLRAIAVVAVVVFHGFPQLLPGGFTGVDVFFVISGYLITSILAADLQRLRFSYRRFYERRVRRLIPSLLIVVAATYLAGWWVLYPWELDDLGNQALAGLLFLANIYQWSESGYFDAPARTKALLHLWSLGVEEQFYLVWPLVLYGLNRASARPIPWVAGLSLGSFLTGLSLMASDPSGAFYLPISRFWQLGIGALLALLPAGSRVALPFLAIIGMALVLASFVLISDGYRYPGFYALAPTLGAALVIWQTPQSNVILKLLSARPLVAIGLISYPLYLWHWPALVLLAIATGETPHWAARLIALALCLALAWLTWRYVEVPVRSSRSRHLVPVIGVATLALCAPLLAAFFSGRNAVRDDLEPEAAELRALPLIDAACEKYARGLNSPYCRLHDPNRAPSIALVGDSHADHLSIGLATALARSQENMIQLGDNGCPPLYGVLRPDLGYQRCLAMQRVLDFVLADPNIHTVVLAARWPMFAAGAKYAPIPNLTVALLDSHQPDETDSARIIQAALARTLAAAVVAGKTVWFVQSVPELNFEPHQCDRQRPIWQLIGRTRQCMLSRTNLDLRKSAYRSIIDAALAAQPGVRSFDPESLLCDAKGCSGRNAEGWLYRDNNHLSAAGSELIGSALAKRIASPDPKE